MTPYECNILIIRNEHVLSNQKFAKGND